MLWWCSPSWQCASLLVVLLSIFTATALPQLMSALLRHMFTAPNQQPWPYGSLRLINVSGLPVQALYSQERALELLDETKFHHKPGDIWVVSYVKSGTTWTIGILAALQNHTAATYAGNMQKTTRTYCPQPELPDLGWEDDGFGHSLEELNNWHLEPRCLKSHWPSRDHVVSSTTTGKNKSKYIYLMRNAQDQMTSHWNQVWGMGFHYGTQNVSFEEGWDNFFNDWILGNVDSGKWFDHVAEWYQRARDDPNGVLFLRYEELKSDPHSAIRRIAAFIDMPPMDDDKVDYVVNVTSFETMRLADEQDLGLRFMRWLGVLRRTHVRQGEVGSNSAHNRFSVAQRAALEREYKLRLQPLGVPRDWVLLDE